MFAATLLLSVGLSGQAMPYADVLEFNNVYNDGGCYLEQAILWSASERDGRLYVVDWCMAKKVKTVTTHKGRRIVYWPTKHGSISVRVCDVVVSHTTYDKELADRRNTKAPFNRGWGLGSSETP